MRWRRREYAATDARVINWREAIAGRGQIAGLGCDGDRTKNIFLRGSECLRDVRGQGNQARKRASSSASNLFYRFEQFAN